MSAYLSGENLRAERIGRTRFPDLNNAPRIGSVLGLGIGGALLLANSTMVRGAIRVTPGLGALSSGGFQLVFSSALPASSGGLVIFGDDFVNLRIAGVASPYSVNWDDFDPAWPTIILNKQHLINYQWVNMT